MRGLRDLPTRNPIGIHLTNRDDDSFVGTAAALENIFGEVTAEVKLEDSQVEGSNGDDQFALAVSIAAVVIGHAGLISFDVHGLIESDFDEPSC